VFRESTYMESDKKAGKPERAKRADLKPMRALFPYLLPYKWMIAGATVALVITAGTVKRHAMNIYGKLDVNSRTQAVAKARDLHLIE